MSTDTVDDLHHAEDMIQQLMHALATARPHLVGDPLTTALHALDAAETYCRPSCGYLDTGECHDGGDDIDTCGCLCQHDEADELATST